MCSFLFWNYLNFQIILPVLSVWGAITKCLGLVVYKQQKIPVLKGLTTKILSYSCMSATDTLGNRSCEIIVASLISLSYFILFFLINFYPCKISHDVFETNLHNKCMQYFYTKLDLIVCWMDKSLNNKIYFPCFVKVALST